MLHYQNYTSSVNSVTLEIKAAVYQTPSVYYLQNILQILGVPNYPVPLYILQMRLNMRHIIYIFIICIHDYYNIYLS